MFQRMTQNKIAALPYQLANLEDFELTLTQCESAVQYVRDGKSFAGHKAIARGLIDAKTTWSLAGWILLLPLISQVSALIYRWVAANRHRLPGGTPACSLDGRQ